MNKPFRTYWKTIHQCIQNWYKVCDQENSVKKCNGWYSSGSKILPKFSIYMGPPV